MPHAIARIDAEELAVELGVLVEAGPFRGVGPYPHSCAEAVEAMPRMSAAAAALETRLLDHFRVLRLPNRPCGQDADYCRGRAHATEVAHGSPVVVSADGASACRGVRGVRSSNPSILRGFKT